MGKTKVTVVTMQSCRLRSKLKSPQNRAKSKPKLLVERPDIGVANVKDGQSLMERHNTKQRTVEVMEMKRLLPMKSLPPN